MSRPRPDAEDPAPRSRDHPGVALFAGMWAATAVWHLLADVGPAGGWAHVVLALAAGLVLLRPGRVGSLAALAAAGVLTVWIEAPGLKSYWLLAGVVDVAILLAVATGAVRGRVSDRQDLADRLFPAARGCLLLFFAFAAFARLNSAFVDPAASCAVDQFWEAARPLGLHADGTPARGPLEWALISLALAVAVAIPVLLVQRRTRGVGALLALGCSLLVGLDRHEPRFAFASVTVALLVLFLPSSSGDWVAERVGSVRARLALRDQRLPGLAALAVVLVPTAVALASVSGAIGRDLGHELGWWSWQLFGLAVLVLTVRFLRQRPATSAPRALRPHHALFLLAPLLVVANGLTPYLEVKTAYAWDGGANLRTVDGETNHLVLPRTLPLLDLHDDLVVIISTDHPGLAALARDGYAIAWAPLRAELSKRPQTRITYRRGHETVAVEHASDRPELVAPVPAWRAKVLHALPVDLSSPERCVDG